MTNGPTGSRAPTPRKRYWKVVAGSVAFVLGLYFVVAYLVVPAAWMEYAHRHPALDSIPFVTETGDDHPGDPINVALIGTEAELRSAMRAAGWDLADALGVRADLKIAADTVLEKPYVNAPVSSLYLWGRKEDVAFEQPVGDDPRQRHHVRFWQAKQVDLQGRPLWAGSATYDLRVGLSHTTGQITHHIAADVDVERQHLFATLESTGDLLLVYFIDGFHELCEGINGGGDPWHTDGRLQVGTLKPPKLD